MSELKVIPVPKMTSIFGHIIGLTEYYLKSEADKVIAHSNYKRCLAMAKLAVEDDYLPWNMKWRKRWLELSEVYRDRR